MTRLFKKAFVHAILWTLWMFGAFSFMNWLGWTSFSTDNLWHWLILAAVMTLLTMITMPLDERHAKRRDHAKRMKERNFQ